MALKTPRATSTPTPARQNVRRFLTTTDQKIADATAYLLVLISRNNDGSGNYQSPGDPNCQIIGPGSPGTPIGAQILVAPSDIVPQKQTTLAAIVVPSIVAPAAATTTDTRHDEPSPVTIGGRMSCGPPSVTVAPDPGGLYLSWPSLDCAGSGYNIYRRDGDCTGTGPYTLIASGVTDAFYLDMTAVAGATYSYRVSAVS